MTKTRVGSIKAAVALAETLRASGRRYWFRGQRRDWPVRSTLARLAPEARDAVMTKIWRYEGWVKSTSGLEKLAAHPDDMIAVAQHYGLPTHFVDFTDDPAIAAFFAADDGVASDVTEEACLICVDVDDLLEFWKSFGGSNPPPEALELTVPDLWRLEAQRGRFLFCPYDNLEWIYNFDRIYFPVTSERFLSSDDIYPVRKSHLEILLDQYFMNEYLIEAQPMIETFPGAVIRIEAPHGSCDMEVFPGGVPEHHSWTSGEVNCWLELSPEVLAATRTDGMFLLDVDTAGDALAIRGSVAEQMMTNLIESRGARGTLMTFVVNPVTRSHLQAVAPLATKLARLWDGMRRLPYTDTDVANAVGMCVALCVALNGNLRSPDRRLWEDAAALCMPRPMEIELAASDGSYSRAFASSQRVAAAVRPDITSFVADGWRRHVDEYPEAVLQTCWNPRSGFVFSELVQLFAIDIIPSQVLARDRAIFYSPARLQTLGLP